MSARAMLCGWHHPCCPSHPVPAGRQAIQALSLDHLGWSFTAGDGPESSKCQLSKRGNRCLHWLGGRCGTGRQQQCLLPWFSGAQEATENTAELQLGLSPQAPTPKPHEGRVFDLTEREQGLAPATKAPKAQHWSVRCAPNPSPAAPHIICTDQLWVSPPRSPAAVQPQPWKGRPAARKGCKGERPMEERKETAQSPTSDAAHTHHLELQPPSGQGCDYFPHYGQGKWVKSILQELGNVQSVIHPGLHG